MHAMFAGMLKSNADIAVLVLDFPRVDRCTYDSWIVAIDAFKSAGKNWEGQLAVLASLPENLPEDIALDLVREGVVPFCGLDDALAAISAACGVVLSETVAPVLLPECRSVVPGNDVSDTEINTDGLTAIEEAAAKHWLVSHSVNTPKGALLNTTGLNAAQLHDALSAIVSTTPWPVVLKSTGSLHKSDSGGVILNIANAEQLVSAMHKMNSKAYFIEEQVSGIVSELLVGIVRDPVHGFLMTIGAGGVQTEILSDTSSALLPITKPQFKSMLASLRCYPLLEGYRGKPGCDIDQLIDTLMQIQQAAISIANDLHELEINPLLCTEQGTIAADALLRVSAQAPLLRELS